MVSIGARGNVKLVQIIPPFGGKITDIHHTLIPPNNFAETVGIEINPYFIRNGKVIREFVTDSSNELVKTGDTELKGQVPVFIFVTASDTAKAFSGGTITSFTVNTGDTFSIPPMTELNQHLDIKAGFYHYYNAYTFFGIANSLLYRFDLNTMKIYDQIPKSDSSHPVEENFSFNSAKTLGVYANFLFVGNTNETPSGGSPTNYPMRLRWSQFNVPDKWINEPDGTGQAGYFDFPANVEIIGLDHYQDFLIVFTTQGIYLVEYVGEPTIFQVRQLIREDETGFLLSPQSFYIIEDNIYFATLRNIYLLRGRSITPLLTGNLQNEYIDAVNKGFYNFTTASYDKNSNYIKFNIPITKSGSNTNDFKQYKVFIIDIFSGNVFTDMYDVSGLTNGFLRGIWMLNDKISNEDISEVFLVNRGSATPLISLYTSSYKSGTTGRFGSSYTGYFYTKTFGYPNSIVPKRIRGIEVLGNGKNINIDIEVSSDGVNFTTNTTLTKSFASVREFDEKFAVNILTQFYRFKFNMPVTGDFTDYKGIKVYEEEYSVFVVR
jgi:hypothetical protein